MRTVCYSKEYETALEHIFRESVHTLGKDYYRKEELDAWAPEEMDRKKWLLQFSSSITLVVLNDEDAPIAFGNIFPDGYVDHIFVLPKYARKGVGTFLLEKLEEKVPGRKYAYASKIAYKFFLKRGYRKVRDNIVRKGDVEIENFLMEKE